MENETLEVLWQQAQQPSNWYLAGGVVLGILALWLISSIRAANRPIVPFRSEGGNIAISPGTLHRLIDHAGRSVSGVSRISSTFRLKREVLNIRLFLTLQASARLPEVEADLRNSVRAALHEQLGLEKIGSIDLVVRRIVGEPTTPRRAALPARETKLSRTAYPDSPVEGLDLGADDEDYGHRRE